MFRWNGLQESLHMYVEVGDLLQLLVRMRVLTKTELFRQWDMPDVGSYSASFVPTSQSLPLDYEP